MRYRSFRSVLPWMVVHPASHKVPRVSWYSGYRPSRLPFAYQGFTVCAAPSQKLRLGCFDFCRSSTPDVRRCPVWALPCSLAATWGISFDYFSSGYLDVSVRRVCLPFGYWNLTSSGLPHSGTRGSGLTCSSPRLFAAYRAFRRLGTPRHPPYALGSLTFFLPLRYHIAMMSMLV